MRLLILCLVLVGFSAFSQAERRRRPQAPAGTTWSHHTTDRSTAESYQKTELPTGTLHTYKDRYAEQNTHQYFVPRQNQVSNNRPTNQYYRPTVAPAAPVQQPHTITVYGSGFVPGQYYNINGQVYQALGPAQPVQVQYYTVPVVIGYYR